MRVRRWCSRAICDNARICSTGWQARFPLVEGLKRTYPWIEAQARRGAARQE